MHQIRSTPFIICILGALSVITPFAIDMYLPAFPQAARDFHVTSATISLTLSSYFIGLALGQILYGPLLDRYGRKRPLYAGLAVFILASIGCAFSPDIYTLIAMRFIQGLGGCVAGIAGLAMVRDFFPVEESARILSRLILFIAISPLLAPSVGGLLLLVGDWRIVFYVLATIVALIVALVYFFLPEGHQPDKTISLKPGPIIKEYLVILENPKFITYALSGAFSFAGLFTYVAGSPVIFLENFQLSTQTYSIIFAILASGFILSSQINVALLRKYTSEQIILHAIITQTATAIIFLLITFMGSTTLIGTMILFYIFLACAGLTYPNCAAIALSPFTKNAGSASALLGFLQLGVGAVISTGISVSNSHDILPIIAILAVTSALGLAILMAGKKRAQYITLDTDL